jgi:hypothetical protein
MKLKDPRGEEEDMGRGSGRALPSHPRAVCPQGAETGRPQLGPAVDTWVGDTSPLNLCSHQGQLTIPSPGHPARPGKVPFWGRRVSYREPQGQRCVPKRGGSRPGWQ